MQLLDSNPESRPTLDDIMKNKWINESMNDTKMRSKLVELIYHQPSASQFSNPPDYNNYLDNGIEFRSVTKSPNSIN